MGRLFWPSIFLSLLLISTAIISEMFQNPTLEKKSDLLYKNPFNANFLKDVTQIHITNRLGELVLSRDGDESNSWWLTHPREIEAGPATIEKLIYSLGNLRIRKVYVQDQIHLSNFSLDNPILTLKLTNPQEGTLTLKMGVINPIDESSYVMLGNSGHIYQIDNFKYHIDTFTLSDFIDARVIAVNTKQIRSINLCGYVQGKKQPIIDFIKNGEGDWLNNASNNTEPLSQEKVKSFLLKLTSFNGLMILDKKPEQQSEKVVVSYLASPRYTIEFKDEKEQLRRYEISNLIEESIPNLRINKQENIVTRASDRDHLYIVNKDFLELLKINEKEFVETDRRKRTDV